MENKDCTVSTSTRTRGVTQLDKVRKSTDCTIWICPKTLKPIGEYSAKYCTWVGLEVKLRISILITDWRKVEKVDKDRMWMAIKQHWNLTDETLKKEMLKVANLAWKNFKCYLISEYKKKKKSPYVPYPYIEKGIWEKICTPKSTPKFEALSRTNSERAKMNKNPHHLGSRGYLGKYDGWDIEKYKGITPEIHNMFHERSRHFLLVRRRKIARDIIVFKI